MHRKSREYYPIDQGLSDEAGSTFADTPAVKDRSASRKGIYDLKLPSFGDQEISVDSCKIRIPASLVKVKDPSLEGDWCLVNLGTGEADDRIQRKDSLFKDFNTRYSLEKVTLSRKPETYLTITTAAKLLRSRYLEGISATNVDHLYRELMSHNVVSFEKEVLLEKSACTDIDFKTDTIYTGDFKKLLRDIYSSAIPHKEQGRGCRMFTAKDNQGIQFSQRETTAFISNPFLKIYHKGIELMHKNHEFMRDYLSSTDVSNIVRMEATLKNKKHFRHLFNHDDTSLATVISMPQDEKRRVFAHAINCHIDRKSTEKTTRQTLKPGMIILFNAMSELLSLEYDFDRVKQTFLNGITCPVTKSRKSKELDELYAIYCNTQLNEVALLESLFWTARKTA